MTRGLDTASILRILPQKPPAVLIDRVLEIQPGTRLLATKAITASDRWTAGHFPGLPVFPASAVIEAMVQAAAILAYATEPFDPQLKIAALLGINKAKFRRVLTPGETLEIDVRLTRQRSNVWRFEASVFVADQSVAEAELLVSIYDRELAF